MHREDFDLDSEYYQEPPRPGLTFKPGDIVRCKGLYEVSMLTHETGPVPTKDSLFIVIHCYYCVAAKRNRVVFRYCSDLSFCNGWGCENFTLVKGVDDAKESDAKPDVS